MMTDCYFATTQTPPPAPADGGDDAGDIYFSYEAMVDPPVKAWQGAPAGQGPVTAPTL